MWVCERHENSFAPLFVGLERRCFADVEFGETYAATALSPLHFN